MSDKLQENRKFHGLITIGKFFKALFWLAVVYVPLSIAVHWFYFILRKSNSQSASIAGGIYSSLSYLVIGAVCACLFYGLSEIIKILILINAKIKDRKT